MIDDLLLLSGNDIPCVEARIVIHQPTIKEIAYVTEQKFWTACQLLKFDKEILPDQDKVDLFNQTNFDIIMMILQQKDIGSKLALTNILSLFSLIFPHYRINIERKKIVLIDENSGERMELNNINFDFFKKIIISMFCLSDDKSKQYNPSGQLAKKIANKLKQGAAKKAELAPDKKIAILSRYVSILAVAENKNINDLMNYTVYQLMDEFKRWQLKMHFDHYERALMAGASGLKEPEDWFKDIHE